MENIKTLVFVTVVASAAALILAVLALVELYKPAHAADIAPSDMDSRLTRLERRIADQEATLSRIEAAQARTPSLEQKSEIDLKNMRNAVQAALSQVAIEMGNLNAKVTKLDEQAKQKPIAKTESKTPPLVEDTVENPYLVYRAASEDTLASIAKKHSVKEEDIIAINPPWMDFSHLRPGQTIYVPRE